MIFFTSDTHFYHQNIIGYCNRPFSNFTEMNKEIIKRWNETVQEKDTVVHLGDFGFGNRSLEILKILNGIKYLIRGNHDRSFSESKLLKAGFQAVYKKPITIVHVTPYSAISIYCCHAPSKIEVNTVNLCGHVHEKWKDREDGVLNVGVDVRNFRPISIREVISEFEDKFPDINIYRVRNREFSEFVKDYDSD